MTEIEKKKKKKKQEKISNLMTLEPQNYCQLFVKLEQLITK